MRKLDFTDVEVLNNVYNTIETLYLNVEMPKTVKEGLLDALSRVGIAKGIANTELITQAITGAMI